MKEDNSMHGNQKKARVVIIVPGKLYFNTKTVTRDKEVITQ